MEDYTKRPLDSLIAKARNVVAPLETSPESAAIVRELCRRLEAAPPTLSAEEPSADGWWCNWCPCDFDSCDELWKHVDLAHGYPAARAPVTPTPEPAVGERLFTPDDPRRTGFKATPEPATVERCNHQRFKHVPSADLFCSMPKGHTGLHGWERWTWPQDPDAGPTRLDAPASPPARPPAVTREPLNESNSRIASRPTYPLSDESMWEGEGKNPRYRPRDLGQRLGYLVEECGEVMSAAGKTIRWGLGSTNPELPPREQETNAAWLEREMRDLELAIVLVRRALPLAAEARRDADRRGGR